MAISIDTFEDEPDDGFRIRRGTSQWTVLEFLANNQEWAFTQSEISERTGVKQSTVGVSLMRLEDKDLARHRGNHWAAPEERKLTTFVAGHTAGSASVTDDYYGEEDAGEICRTHEAQ
jgi:hypothetical protein